jgi:hypothetical protein
MIRLRAIMPMGAAEGAGAALGSSRGSLGANALPSQRTRWTTGVGLAATTALTGAGFTGVVRAFARARSGTTLARGAHPAETRSVASHSPRRRAFDDEFIADADNERALFVLAIFAGAQPTVTRDGPAHRFARALFAAGFFAGTFDTPSAKKTRELRSPPEEPTLIPVHREGPPVQGSLT